MNVCFDLCSGVCGKSTDACTNEVMNSIVLRAQIVVSKIFLKQHCGEERYQDNVKTNRFHLAFSVYSDNAQRTSKRAWKEQKPYYSPAALGVLLFSYHVLMSAHTHG